MGGEGVRFHRALRCLLRPRMWHHTADLLPVSQSNGPDHLSAIDRVYLGQFLQYGCAAGLLLAYQSCEGLHLWVSSVYYPRPFPEEATRGLRAVLRLACAKLLQPSSHCGVSKN